MAAQYWIRGPGGTKGPLSQQQIRDLVSTRELAPTMEISTDGNTWHLAGKVKGLFPAPEILPILDFASQLPPEAPPVSTAEAAPHPVQPGLQPLPAADSESGVAAMTDQAARLPNAAAQRTEAPSGTSKLISAFILAILALAFFYFGGWFIAWGAILYGRLDDLYIGDGIAMRFNGLYYGLVFAPRFFDSPLVSFVLGGMGLGAASIAFNDLTGK